MFRGLSPWLLTQLLMMRAVGRAKRGRFVRLRPRSFEDENWETMSLPKFSVDA